ncbi:hypothetical protein GCM10010324_25940 [Streptomyces hiroshimensis]|uniref:Uncharacterized protein n=1 Tax=Streptomyces hiroshimensis TaxID=66424 RepID=A0ABQ2YBP3_9ACTN|nr:hypothetical protein GCM10010324_25940 [Streptomyces hiroshimensis]
MVRSDPSVKTVGRGFGCLCRLHCGLSHVAYVKGEIVLRVEDGAHGDGTPDRVFQVARRVDRRSAPVRSASEL